MKRLLMFLMSLFTPILIMASNDPYLDAAYSKAISESFSTLFTVVGFLIGIGVAGAIMVAIVCAIMKLFEKLLILTVGKDGGTYFAISNMILTILAVLFGHAASKKRSRKSG